MGTLNAVSTSVSDGTTSKTARLELFSDGVIAIAITLRLRIKRDRDRVPSLEMIEALHTLAGSVREIRSL